ncbi:acyl-CoA thioesterase [Rhizobium leguminosarum]|uniref:acyl-CoA thioesterase n=1 Tax=Rhizobium leguminosarum TaxID=384 RepID=UPI003F94F74F
MKPAVHPLSAFPWKTGHDLRYGDLDTNGHVNNGAFNSIMETSRTLLFREEAGSEWSTSDLSLHGTIDFIGELTWPGSVGAGLGITRIGNSSITIRQALFSEESCAAIAETVIVATDPATRRPTRLDESLRAALGRRGNAGLKLPPASVLDCRGSAVSSRSVR